MKYYDIEIPNWDKYQVRKDVQSMKFFRLESRVFYDPKLADCSPVVKLLWIYCLTVAATENTHCPRIVSSMATRCLQLRGNLFTKSMEELEQNQLLIIKSRYENVPRIDKNRIDKNRIERVSKSVLTPPPQRLKKSFVLDLWADKLADKLHKIRLPLNPARSKKLSERLKNYASEKEWVEAFEKIAASNFLTGKNDRGWKASFDWVLQPDSITKVLEGKYDNQDQTGENSSPWGDLFSGEANT